MTANKDDALAPAPALSQQPKPRLRASLRSDAGPWWIVTGPAHLNGKRKLGPFVTRDLALEVRSYVEKVERRDDLWVVNGADIPAR